MDRIPQDKLLELLHKQRELYWTRNGYFFLFHGLLGTSLSLGEQTPVLYIIFGLFGVLFSISWLTINMRSYENIIMWIYELSSDANEIHSDLVLHYHILGKEVPIDSPLPALTLLFWSVILLYGLLQA